jgi:hypothetical protein
LDHREVAESEAATMWVGVEGVSGFELAVYA